MNSEHESFLRPFFRSMNASFSGQWCVLHSYETLPHFSESDVDMAFSSNKVDRLEQIIIDVANKYGWSLYQKLWYDVQACFYYVLKNDTDGTELAIDFLIDNNGIGKYGFKTSLLTDNCTIYNEIIPIPNSSVAFSYKFIKRIVKKRELKDDIAYLLEHYQKADFSVVKAIMLEQFGTEGLKIVEKEISKNNFGLREQEMHKLLLLRKKHITKRSYWESLRVLNRVFKPCGMVINVPQLSNKQFTEFIELLYQKVGLLFRFVIQNSENKISIDFKGLVGSTLVIKMPKFLNKKKAIQQNWFGYQRYQSIDVKDWDNIEHLVNVYYENILFVLKERNKYRRLISNE